MINVYGSGITNYCLNPKPTSIAASPKLWDMLTMYFLIIDCQLHGCPQMMKLASMAPLCTPFLSVNHLTCPLRVSLLISHLLPYRIKYALTKTNIWKSFSPNGQKQHEVGPFKVICIFVPWKAPEARESSSSFGVSGNLEDVSHSISRIIGSCQSPTHCGRGCLVHLGHTLVLTLPFTAYHHPHKHQTSIFWCF